MFTGLIETLGSVAGTRMAGSAIELRIRTTLTPELAPGDSLAVNGVCLTVTATRDGEVHADIGPETARITTLGALRRGQPVNLERSLRADGRIGGHFVQGHVDGMGTLAELRADGTAHWLSIRYPEDLAPLIMPKGSIAVDGTSLTVASLGGGRFEVMIIPFTWAHTALSSLRAGNRVNLECDMIGKYVARALERIGSPGPSDHLRPQPESS